MKKILLISWYFPPLRSIASLRFSKWAKYLPDYGYYPIVITAEKSFLAELDMPLELKKGEVHELRYFNPIMRYRHTLNDGKEESEDKSDNMFSSSVRNSIVRAGIKLAAPFEERGVIFAPTRIPSFHDFWILKGLHKALEILENNKSNIDALISTYSPPASHIIAYYIKKKHPKIKWIADYRDLWAEHPIYKGLAPFTIFEKYIENKILARADRITTVSEGLASVLRNRCGDKVFVIENGFDEDEMKEVSPWDFKNSQGVNIVYTGTIYKQKQNPYPILEALNTLISKNEGESNSHIKLHFYITNRAGRDYLAEIVRRLKLEKYVGIEDSVPYEKSLSLQKGADAVLLLERESRAENDKGVLTGKVFEYIGNRKPILGIGFGEGTELGNLLVRTGLGFPLGDDVQKIKAFLVEMMQVKKHRNLERIIAPCEDVISYYSRRQQVARLVELTHSIQ